MRARLLLISALLGAAASAQEPAPAPGPSLRLEQALALATEGNRDLKMAREAITLAAAQRDRAFAFIQPTADVGLSYRINDREIAFDMASSFEDSGIGDVFTGLYENIGFIYGKIYEDDPAGFNDDCDQIAEINGFDDCAALTAAFLDGDGVGGAPDTGESEPIVVQQKANFYVSAQFQWPLSPRVAPLATAGKHAVQAAEETLDHATEQVLAGVVQAYAYTWQAQEGARLLGEQVGLAAEHRKTAENLAAAGAITRDQVLRARVEEAKLQLQLRQVQQQHRQARRALGLLLGVGEPPWTDLEPLPPVAIETQGVDSIVVTAPQDRSDLGAARAQALAAHQMKIDGGLQFLPTFAVTGQLNWIAKVSGFDTKKTSWVIGLNASIPIWDGGLRVQNIRETAARERQAAQRVEALQAQVEVEVRDAWDNWLSAQEALPVAQLERDLSAEGYRLTEVRYEAGAATQLELLDARSGLQAAELGLVQRRVDLALTGARLLAAAGRFKLWARTNAG